MKKCLQNQNIEKKCVILRVDYNVPIENQIILDDAKIKGTLETINYLLEKKCKIIILSHLGKIKKEEDKKKYSLEIVANHLKSLLNQEVYFSKENFGTPVIERVRNLKEQEILVLENTRFLDIPKKLESNCNPQLSEFWASLGDIFVMDAFASSHRHHASTYGISMYLPSCIGFQIQKEMKILEENVIHPKHPFTMIMGGAKIDDKISLIESLLPKCDYILCGGGIANTCLEALGFNIGESLTTDSPYILERVKNFLLNNKEKFMLPLDVIVGSTYDKNYVKYKKINEVNENEIILDIGVKTLEKYLTAIKNSKSIFLNGTVGYYENEMFANGTKELLNLLKNSNASVVVGGGDAAASVRRFGYENDFTYISTGGGATLEYLAKEKLIALEKIEEEGEIIETLDM